MDVPEADLLSLMQEEDVFEVVLDQMTTASYETPYSHSSDGSSESSQPPAPDQQGGVSQRSHIFIEKSSRARRPPSSKKKRAIEEPQEEDEGEDPEAKRQRRLVRNRQSAAQSRERKKELQTELEQKIAFLVAQNEKLSKQMRQMNAQMTEMQAENVGLKHQLVAAVTAPPPPPAQQVPTMEQILEGLLNTIPPAASAQQPWTASAPDAVQHSARNAQAQQGQPTYIDHKSAVLTGSPYDSPQLDQFTRLSLALLMQCLLSAHILIGRSRAAAEAVVLAAMFATCGLALTAVTQASPADHLPSVTFTPAPQLRLSSNGEKPP